MATPKIKIYWLNKGYTSDNDNDVQSVVNDELLPIVDKQTLPENAYYLKGVLKYEESLISLGTQVVETLSVSGNQTQSGTNTNWIATGGFKPVLKENGTTLIPEENYTVDGSAGTVTFDNSVYNGTFPVNVQATYYVVGGNSSTIWVVSHAPMYSGNNYMFKEEVYTSSDVFIPYTGYVVDLTTGRITFPASITNPKIIYYNEVDTAHLFVSDFPNWLTNHLRTNPDIFVGLHDYPGDDSTDGGGNPVVQGPIPKCVDSGYQIDFRQGSVYFSDEVETHDADPGNSIDEHKVRANFAYLKEIKNVTKQKLDLVSTLNGYQYKAVTEQRWTDSHNRRWIVKNDYLTPRFFEIDGEVIPKELQVNPYDELELLNAIRIDTNDTYDNGANRDKIIFYFTGNNNETATVVINTVNVLIANKNNYLSWDHGTANAYLFTNPGEVITRTYNGLQVDILWNGTGSLFFTLDDFVHVTSSSTSASSSSTSKSSTSISSSSTSMSSSSSSVSVSSSSTSDSSSSSSTSDSSSSTDVTKHRFNAKVHNLIKDTNNNIYIAGEFTQLDNHQRYYIAKFNSDGLTADWSYQINNIVRTQFIDGNYLYIGGKFTNINGHAINRVARININNGQLDTTWNPDANSTVLAISADTNGVFIGGYFTHIGNNNTKYCLAKVNKTDGQLIGSFTTVCDNAVYALNVCGDTLYIGGSFTQVGGSGISHVAAVNVTDGHILTWFNLSVNDRIITMSADNNNVYIAGNFTEVDGKTRNHVARFDKTHGKLDYEWNPDADNIVESVFVDNNDNDVYLGGQFTNIKGHASTYLARFNSDSWFDTSFTPSINGMVRSILIINNKIHFGGDFTIVDGQAANYYEVLTKTGASFSSSSMSDSNSSSSSSFSNSSCSSSCSSSLSSSSFSNSSSSFSSSSAGWLNNYDLNGVVNSIVADGIGGYYIGGAFTQIDGVTRNHICHILPTGAVSDWNPNCNGEVRKIIIDGSNMYLAGDFTVVNNNVYRNYIAKIDKSTGVADGSWTYVCNARVRSMTLDGDYLYVGGDFTNVSSNSRNHLAKIHKTIVAVDSWNANANNVVYVVTHDNDGVYFGGLFTQVNGVNKYYAAKANKTNGTLYAWEIDSNSTVSDILIDGINVYVAGSFTSINNETRNYLVCVNNTDGLTVDAFVPVLDGATNKLMLHNNYLYVGGSFANVESQPVARLTKLNKTTGNLYTDFRPNPNNSVYDIVFDNSLVHIGGSFTQINNIDRKYYAFISETINSSSSSSSSSNAWLSDYNFNGDVNIVEEDEYHGHYVGGTFTQVDGKTRNHICYISASGTVTDWNPNINGAVNDIKYINGDIYVGGSFTLVGAITRNNVVKINVSGVVDNTWNPNVNNTVNTIEEHNGKIYVGGNFTHVGGVSHIRVARLNSDGTIDSTWTPSVNGVVYSLAYYMDNIYIGGTFTQINSTNRNNLGAVNIFNQLMTFNPDVNNTVRVVYVAYDSVYVGGSFTHIGGATHNYIAKFIDNDVKSFNAEINNSVFDITSLDDCCVIAAGDFTQSHSEKHLRVVKLNKNTGSLVDNSLFDCNNTVYSVSVNDNLDMVHLGGSFTKTNGLTKRHYSVVGKTNITSSSSSSHSLSSVSSSSCSSSSTSFSSSSTSSISFSSSSESNSISSSSSSNELLDNYNINGDVHVVVDDGSGGHYIGGDFTQVDGKTRNNVCHIRSDGAVSNWNPNTNDTVKSIAVGSSYVYLAGDFTQAGGVTRNYLVKVDKTNGTVDVSWNPDPNGLVLSMLLIGTDLYIGGVFTSINTTARNHAAKVNTGTAAVDASWNPAPNNNVHVIKTDGIDIYLGGSFNSVDSTTRYFIAKTNTTDGSVQSWHPYTNGTVYDIVIDGSDIYVAGNFTTIHDEDRTCVAKTHTANDAIDTNFSPTINNTVYTATIDSGDIYIGGDFQDINGKDVDRLAKLDKIDAEVDTAWRPQPNNRILSVNITSKHFIAGGLFTNFNNSAIRGLGIVNTTNINSSSCSSSSSNEWLGDYDFNGDVYALESNYVGGAFTSVKGETRNRLCYITSTGTLGSMNVSFNGDIHALYEYDGYLYVGGEFTQIDAHNIKYLARINTTTQQLDTSFSFDIDNFVRCFQYHTGYLYVGGDFTEIDDVDVDYLARIDLTYGIVDSWNLKLNNTVYAIESEGYSHGLYAGGAFTQKDGQEQKYFVEIFSGYMSGSAFDFDNVVRSIVYDEYHIYNYLYVGGDFTSYFKRYNVHNNSFGVSSLDKTLNNRVRIIKKSIDNVTGDKIVYIGGDFTHVDGHSYVLRATTIYNIETQLDTYNCNNKVFTLDTSDNLSRVRLGGQFTNVNLESKKYFAVEPYGVIVSSSSSRSSTPYSSSSTSFSSSSTSFSSSSTSFSSNNWLGNYNFNGTVYVILDDGSGGHYVGGAFTQVDGKTRNRLCHIDQNGAITSLSVNLSNTVYALTLDSAHLYVGGSFTYNSINYLIRINKNTQVVDSTFDMSFNNSVWSLYLDGSRLYVAGIFTEVDSTAKNYVAKINTSTKQLDNSWSVSVASGSGFQVNTITGDTSYVYFGGEFESVNSTTRYNVAKVAKSDGTLQTWHPYTNDEVKDIVIDGSVIYMGGNFTSTRGTAVTYITKVNNSDGTVDSGFSVSLNGYINCMVVQSAYLYIGGTFTVLNNSTTYRLARINKLTGGFDTTWRPNVDSTIYDVNLDTNYLYVGGSFNNVNNQTQNYYAVFNTSISYNSSSSSCSSSNAWMGDYSFNGNVNVIGDNGNYIGGSFTQVDGLTRNHICEISDSGTVTDFNINCDGDVYAVEHGDDGYCYVGGNFTHVGGESIKYLCRFNESNGTLDTSFSLNLNGAVRAIKYNSYSNPDVIYIGGDFTEIDEIIIKRLAKMNTQGIVSTWNPDLNNSVNSLALDTYGLYIGGSFTQIGSTTRQYFAKFNNNDNLTSLDLSLNGIVYVLNLLNVQVEPRHYRDLFVGGAFTNGLKRLDLTDDTVTDFTFNNTVRAINMAYTISGSAEPYQFYLYLYIGGDFTTIHTNINSSKTARLLLHDDVYASHVTRGTANYYTWVTCDNSVNTIYSHNNYHSTNYARIGGVFNTVNSDTRHYYDVVSVEETSSSSSSVSSMSNSSSSISNSSSSSS